jgi:hypothetical protein
MQTFISVVESFLTHYSVGYNSMGMGMGKNRVFLYKNTTKKDVYVIYRTL